MRIQHNIMAMNAYRNYNTNTSALSKNLEKLSSGYKINRAGDDAAGLAISEKMRAQITGLEAAQKNVKDGISLVKTAEGAMQEIQDMLNRMDYLATQSANGTYQDEVDRENLNKEMEALKTEINRIADSANFNGIKLLDGSLDTKVEAVDEVKETQTIDTTTTEALTVANGKLAEVGKTLGVDTVLHNDALTDGGTEFSVDLHNFKFDATAAGNSMTLKVGDTEITLTANDNAGVLTSDALVDAFLGNNGSIDVTISGDENKGISSVSNMYINGQAFTVEAGDKDYRLTFKQDAAPTSEAEEVNGSMEVSISGQVEANLAKYSFDVGDLGAETVNGVLSIGGETYTIADAGGGTAESWATVFANIKKSGGLSDFNVDIDGTTVTLTAKETGKKSAPAISYKATTAGDTTSTTASATGAAAVAATCAAAETTAQLATGETFTVNGVEVDPGFTAGSAINTPVDIGDTGYQYTIKGTGEITIAAKAGTGAAQNGTVSVSVAGGNAETFTFAGGTDAVKDSQTYDVTGWNSSKLGDLTVQFAAADVTLNYDDLKAAGEDGLAVGSTGYIATLNGNELVLTAKNAGLLNSGSGDTATPAARSTGIKFYKFDPDAEVKSTDVTVTEEARGAEGGELQGITTGAHGDFNVSTTAIKNVTAGGVDRLASTYFDLTEDMVRSGSVLTIAGVDYTFTTDEADIGKAGFVDARGDLETIAKNLTDAAKGNATYTVGHDGSRITLTETVENADLYTKDADGNVTYSGDYDLRTQEGIEKSLGFKGVKYTQEVVTTEAKDGGKALNLQIGDTSDDFNQMKVTIGDMHVNAMGTFDDDGKLTKSINDIDILNPENAAEAVDVIKNAINYVSSVRGDLGAYQNRLEHTANNLSVMAENIQDAESTIRDTDIAEEMMAYTKNNILVQSAQAMLAQANAVPQGVLQLLG